MKKLIRNRKIRFGVGVLAALVLLGVILMLAASDKKEDSQATDVTQRRTARISITANGFEPATLQVEAGTVIIWTNEDNNIHQVAANPHPTRDELPELYSEILNNGQTYEFTAEKSGTYGYHDQSNPTINGTLQVN